MQRALGPAPPRRCPAALSWPCRGLLLLLLRAACEGEAPTPAAVRRPTSHAGATGVYLLQAAMSNYTPAASIIAAGVLWGKLLAGVARAGRVPPIFAEFGDQQAPAGGSAAPALAALGAAAAPPANGLARRRSRRTAALAGVAESLHLVRQAEANSAAFQRNMQQEISEVVHGMLGPDVGPDQPLMEAGLDSLGGCPAARAGTGAAPGGRQRPLCCACSKPPPGPCRRGGAAQHHPKQAGRRAAGHRHL